MTRSSDGMDVDAADNRRVIQRAIESEQLFHSIADSVTDSIFCKDLAFRYTFVNAAMERLLGHPAAEILGKTPAELFGETAARIIADVDEPCARGETVDAVRTLDLVDEERILHTIQGPLRDKNGNIYGIGGIVRDVTDQRRLEEQVQQSEKLSAIGRLAGGIAHDLNNQLAGVMGFADLILSSLCDDPRHADYAQGIAESIRRASDLTSRLLTFARKQRQRMVPFDVHTVIRDTAALLRRSIDKRIEVLTHCDAPESVVSGDASQVQNAILNLALNSRDALPEGGEIRIRTDTVVIDSAERARRGPEARPGTFVRITVADNGAGMTTETLRHAFEPFFTTKEFGKGTGLGLATVYGTVKNHSGFVEIESHPGAGTTVTIFLPVVLDAPESLLQGDASVTSGTGRILIADDEDLVREALAGILRNAGYEVTDFSSGAALVECFGQAPATVDLVVLDIVMPGMTGPDVLKQLQRIRPDVRALFVSGYQHEGPLDGAGVPAHHVCLQKPFSKTDLTRAVAEALSGTRGG